MQSITKPDTAELDEHKTEAMARLKLLLSFVAGVVTFFLRVLVTPRLPFWTELALRRNPVLRFWLFVNWPIVGLSLCVLFAFLAIVKRRQPFAFTYAFLVGHGFPFLVFHSLLGWV